MKPTFFFRFAYCWRLPLFLALLLDPIEVTLGQTQPSSQSKPQSSANSAEHLQTWEQLSTKFDQTLANQEQLLRTLYDQIATLENSSQSLTGLYETLLAQNKSLKTFNEQIGTRMQESDEDLAAAYAEIDTLGNSLRARTIICILLAVFLFGMILIPLIAKAVMR